MNIWIKYSPLAYTYFTRINGWFMNILWYLWKHFSICLSTIFLLFLLKYITFFESFYLFLTYFYLFCVFQIFYEIWYIWNDVFSVKKEKYPSFHVDANVNNKFWVMQVIFRIIFWWVLILWIYYINVRLFTYFIILIIALWFFYFIHNSVRNYSINMFTFLFLRICKIFVFLIEIFCLIKASHIVDDLIIVIFLYYVFELFPERMLAYNKRLWWQNYSLMLGYSYLFIFIVFLIWGTMTKNLLFIIPIFVIIPKLFFFLKREPHAFSFKNNR